MAHVFDNRLCTELANVPFAQPGFDALNMSSPVLVQMNPGGKWEQNVPVSLDENRLRATVQHLACSDAMNPGSYCRQCAADAKQQCGNSNYIPVIMMPVYPVCQCPCDMEGKIKQMTDEEAPKHKPAKWSKPTESDAEKDKKPKKRGWTMQRLTDFDLLSQW